MDQADRHMAPGGQAPEILAGAPAGAVLPKGDIAHSLGTVLPTPMPPLALQPALGTGLAGSQSGQGIHALAGGGAGCGHRAGELRDLRDEGPTGSQLSLHRGPALDGADGEAPRQDGDGSRSLLSGGKPLSAILPKPWKPSNEVALLFDNLHILVNQRDHHQ